jgi:hypothetical protein
VVMAFSKSFPKSTDKSMYPKWEEVYLSEDEETAVDAEARRANIALMRASINDAEAIMREQGLKGFQTDLIRIAIALFEKRASHSIYWKESKAKAKFDKAKQ